MGQPRGPYYPFASHQPNDLGGLRCQAQFRSSMRERMRTYFVTLFGHLTKSIPFDKLKTIDLPSYKSCYNIEHSPKRHRIKRLIECLRMRFPTIVNSQRDYGSQVHDLSTSVPATRIVDCGSCLDIKKRSLAPQLSRMLPVLSP